VVIHKITFSDQDMKSRIAYALPALLLAVLVVVYGFAPNTTSTVTNKKMVPVDTTKKGPRIKLEEDNYDFHDIEQGTKAVHVFMVGNTGTDTLVITGTRPSCGCTAAVNDNSRLAPGQVSRLTVTFDANNKPEGPIIKSVTISSNDPTKPEAMVRIQGRVVKSKLAHKTMMHLDGLFQGDCAKCHVDKGKGELGARLYEADCAICHGLKTDGKPGPELASEAMMKHTPKQWQTIIADGIQNTGMPAFHTRNKGPLSDEEIASLVEYMGAFKKEAERNNMIKSIKPGASGTTGSLEAKQVKGMASSTSGSANNTHK